MAKRYLLFASPAIAIAALVATAAITQTAMAPPADSAAATPDNAVLLTIFLRHDQSRPLGELKANSADRVSTMLSRRLWSKW